MAEGAEADTLFNLSGLGYSSKTKKIVRPVAYVVAAGHIALALQPLSAIAQETTTEEPITLGRMIDRLQDAELVERRADPADRRAWRLHLTPKGTDLILQLQPYARLTIDQALDGVSDAESDRLMETLMRLRSNLSRRPGVEEQRPA